MDKLEPKQLPVCTSCKSALKIVQTIAVGRSGAAIIIYQCVACQRLHWQEPEKPD
jgi:predicted RNA-binding Zn-ribbon protein involved in translation (DUF1610 family)